MRPLLSTNADDMEPVGSCSGLYLIPREQIADYYRGHLFVGLLGILFLLIHANLPSY